MKRFDPDGRLVQSKDRADCAVHALSSVLQISYQAAYDFCAESGRKPNEGTYSDKLPPIINKHYGREVLIQIPNRREWQWKALSHFVDLYPVGRFYISVRGHAISMINGVVVDTTTQRRQPSAIVRQGWVVKDTWIGRVQDIMDMNIPEF